MKGHGNILQRHTAHATKCKNIETSSVKCAEQDTWTMFNIYVCLVWRRSHTDDKYRKPSEQQLEVIKFEYVDFSFVENVTPTPSIIYKISISFAWSSMTSKAVCKSIGTMETGGGCLMVSRTGCSSDDRQVYSFGRFLKNKPEEVTVNVFLCCISSKSDGLRTDEGCIRIIEGIYEVVLFGIYSRFRQGRRSAPWITYRGFQVFFLSILQDSTKVNVERQSPTIKTIKFWYQMRLNNFQMSLTLLLVSKFMLSDSVPMVSFQCFTTSCLILSKKRMLKMTKTWKSPRQRRRIFLRWIKCNCNSLAIKLNTIKKRGNCNSLECLWLPLRYINIAPG